MERLSKLPTTDLQWALDFLEWNHYVLFKGGYLLSRFPWYVLSEGIGNFKSLCFHLIVEWLVGVGGRSSRVSVSTESWCFILEPSTSFSKS